MLTKLLQNGLQGHRAHVQTKGSVEGLDWQTAGRQVPECPHTIFQMVSHMIYWQEFFLKEAQGEAPAIPGSASASWGASAAPADQAQWDGTVARFQANVDRGIALADGDLETVVGAQGQTRGLSIANMMCHTSYHIGQIALVRRMLGAWPPPCGGDTW